MLEKEMKTLISRKRYEQINEIYEWDTTELQTNFYYMDEKNSLKKRGINVRVRKTDDKILLQIKTPVGGNKSLHVSHEAELEISEVPFVIKSERLEEYLSFDAGDLYLLGHLKTHRKEFHWDDENLICLDKSFYLGTIDYEVEVEFTEKQMNSKLADELEDYGVEFRGDSSGKRSRFLKKLKEVLNN